MAQMKTTRKLDADELDEFAQRILEKDAKLEEQCEQIDILQTQFKKQLLMSQLKTIKKVDADQVEELVQNILEKDAELKEHKE